MSDDNIPLYRLFTNDEDSTATVYVRWDHVDFDIDQEESWKNVRGTLPDVPILDEYRVSMPRLDEGASDQFGPGTLWWADQSSFEHNGVHYYKIAIVPVYDDDIEILHSIFSVRIDEETKERIEEQREQERKSFLARRFLEELEGHWKEADLILGDFRRFDVVRQDIENFDRVDLELTELAENLSQSFEQPEDWVSNRFGASYELQSPSAADVYLIPLTQKNVDLAGMLLPNSIRQFLERSINVGRYSLLIQFRHVHTAPFVLQRVLTTAVLLETQRLDLDTAGTLLQGDFASAVEQINDTGTHKAFSLMSGKSEWRTKTSSITLAPYSLTFPLITNKTVFVVEGQNDALSLYHLYKYTGQFVKDPIVLNLGTASATTYQRTDLPLFCKSSTDVRVFLDNEGLSQATADFLRDAAGFKRISLASRNIPYLLEIEKQRSSFDQLEAAKQQYMKAETWTKKYFPEIEQKFSFRRAFDQECSNPETFKRSKCEVAPGVTLNKLPFLGKSPKPVEVDPDDWVTTVAKKLGIVPG